MSGGLADALRDGFFSKNLKEPGELTPIPGAIHIDEPSLNLAIASRWAGTHQIWRPIERLTRKGDIHE